MKVLATIGWLSDGVLIFCGHCWPSPNEDGQNATKMNMPGLSHRYAQVPFGRMAPSTSQISESFCAVASWFLVDTSLFLGDKKRKYCSFAKWSSSPESVIVSLNRLTPLFAQDGRICWHASAPVSHVRQESGLGIPKVTSLNIVR